MSFPRVRIVSPGLAAANNGNWHTASRWQRFLSSAARVDIASSWHGEPAEALIALHAARSAESIARFRDQHPRRPLAVVLTGTDLYRDLAAGNADAGHSLECASHIVVLQDEALGRLPPAVRAKTRVIVQSASRLVRRDKSASSFDFAAVGHLRDEKDPLTLMRAARDLPAGSPIRIVHIGRALDEALGRAAQHTMAECPRYVWLGGLAPAHARRWIARSRALVHMSLMEGGAHVVIEAIRSDVPVLASRIDGNVGLLGRDYDGYFAPGDSAGLAALMQRFAAEPAYAAHLATQCAALQPRFAPANEAASVRALLHDLMAD